MTNLALCGFVPSEAFFSSTVAGQWVAFGMVWLLLLRLSHFAALWVGKRPKPGSRFHFASVCVTGLFIHQLALESCLSHATRR